MHLGMRTLKTAKKLGGLLTSACKAFNLAIDARDLDHLYLTLRDFTAASDRRISVGFYGRAKIS